MPDILLLTRSNIRQLVSWPLLIEAVRTALLQREAGKVATSVSAQITMPNALLHLKAGAIFDPGVLSVKANLRPQGGTVSGAVLVFDTSEGRIKAILDSADITAMRTAALATLAALTLCRPGPLTLAMIGAGPVAAQVLTALPLFMPIEHVRLWSRSTERAAALGRSITLPATIFDTPAKAACEADIIVTATPSRSPLLETNDLKDGALVLALGADSPNKRELGLSVLMSAKIIADQQEDVIKVGEAAYLPADELHRVHAELGAILAGRVDIASLHCKDSKLIVFDSVGSAIIDASVCNAVIGLALKNEIGRYLDLSE